jgi:AcrR family transcriptional regulator
LRGLLKIVFSISDMRISEAALARSLEPARARAARELEGLVAAALRVLRRKGYARATVADVLAEAGLSSRAFYRHFRSKHELFLAVFERDSSESSRRMQERLEALKGPLARLTAWIDEVLSLGYDPRRARRTRLLAEEAASLRAEHPREFLVIQQAVYAPLVRILLAARDEGQLPGARPEDDARSLHAVAWSLVEARLGGGGPPDAEAARAEVLRFCLPALRAAAPDHARERGAPA